MARIVVLANSERPGGHCLAGIDLGTGQWIRPVPAAGDAIPTARCVVDNKVIALRDVLEIELIRPRVTPEFQYENHVVRSWNWRIAGRFRLDAILRYIDPLSPVLYTPSDRVSPRLFKELPPAEWKSLQLVQPRNVTFARHYYTPNRWVANFSDPAGNKYSLRITDPEVTRRLEAGHRISKQSLLTISLTKPWAPDQKKMRPFCYKVVAAVMEA